MEEKLQGGPEKKTTQLSITQRRNDQISDHDKGSAEWLAILSTNFSSTTIKVGSLTLL